MRPPDAASWTAPALLSLHLDGALAYRQPHLLRHASSKHLAAITLLQESDALDSCCVHTCRELHATLMGKGGREEGRKKYIEIDKTPKHNNMKRGRVE